MLIFEDASNLPATYDDWIIIAEQAEKQFLADGLKVVRAEINPSTFPSWCIENGFPNIDKHARAAFAARVAVDSH